jgi:hypothetical protein
MKAIGREGKRSNVDILRMSAIGSSSAGGCDQFRGALLHLAWVRNMTGCDGLQKAFGRVGRRQ